MSEKKPGKSNKSRPRIVPKGIRMRRDLLRVRRARWVDYKNLPLLTRYLSNFARILPRRLTGATQKHQRMVEQALKRARYLALMPYTLQHLMPEGKGPK